jgi:hypothetical protein
MVQAKGATPKSTVDKNNGWLRAGAVRKKEIAKLLWRLSIGNAHACFWWRESKDLLGESGNRSCGQKRASRHGTILLKQ